MNILVVDDEIEILNSLKRVLKYHGMTNVTTCDSGKKAIELILNHPFDVVLLDILMPEVNGFNVLEATKHRSVQTEYIIITGCNDIEAAVRSVKSGAYDYLVKPLEPSRVLLSVERAYEKRALSTGFFSAGSFSNKNIPEAFSSIITQDQTMLRLIHYADIMSRSGKPILISGESGTGKELFAQSIHRAGSHQAGEFVAVNVASVQGNLFESQFFGHTKGAFTGADSDAAGYFEFADRGTLLLDEIGELPLEMQSKFLRVLEDKQVTRLGETRHRKVDVQILSATNRNLSRECENGIFRFDLFYRLSSAVIQIPPLRERRGDIPLLVEFFLEQAQERYKKRIRSIAPDVMTALQQSDWPGNVRALRHVMENGVILCETDCLTMGHFELNSPFESFAPEKKALSLKENELEHIAYVMRLVNGNRQTAAETLGISLRQLQRKLAFMKEAGNWAELFRKE